MRRLLTIGLVGAALVGAAGIALASSDDYRVSVVLQSATNVVEGGTVQIDGFEAGTVEDIAVQDGKAKLTLALNTNYAPLHDGAVVKIVWKAVLGERLIAVTDGPDSNATIPDGGMISGEMPVPMEVDQVLAALDEPTRQRLASLIRRLDGTVQGNEQDLNQTVRSAGPALAALGEVLRALGTDGPAIKQLVNQLDGIVTTLVNRESNVRNVIDQVSTTTRVTAQQKEALAEVLGKLPETLRTADTTLGHVPGVADKAVPLLRDLQPATEKLPSVARNLRPVLSDLRPLVAELRPTLTAAQNLLTYTPGLLDSAHATFPGANSLVADLAPALSFLRPFTPEAAGILANWGSANANYDSNGHYARIYVQAGAGSINVNPGVMPPGYTKDLTPQPGSLVDQPWTDAFGSGVR